MDGDQTVSAVYSVLALGLVLSALIAQRLPIARLLKMILAWTGIFALAFILFSFRPEIGAAWQRIKGELNGTPRQTSGQHKVTLTRMDDGHFWLRATVNGQAVDFMVDSGASYTAINATTAQKLQIDYMSAMRTVELDTANGQVKAKLVDIEGFRLDDRTFDNLHAVVSDSFGDTNVVGMNFLDTLASWNVSGDQMTLYLH